jgi:AcrR family transcriptional regulator
MTTSAAVVVVDETQRRIRDVPAPQPLLDRDRERRLTLRQRQILDQLGAVFTDGFATLTMAELAASLNCSLRTLYTLAPSRDELVLIVVDRSLWRIGRNARAAIEPGMAPLDALRAYLASAMLAISGWTEAFARDLAAVPAARRLSTGHDQYLFDITKTLLDLAVERGDVAPIDTAAISHVLAGLGTEFTRPEVYATLRSSPKDAADTVVGVVLRGLSGPDHRPPTTRRRTR